MLKILLLLIIFLPLCASVIAGLIFYKKNTFSKIITTANVFISFLLTLILYTKTPISGDIISIPLMSWIEYHDFSFEIKLIVDKLTTTMAFIITLISFLVHVYSWGYMEKDPSQPRFFSYISLFTFMMLILVFSSNLLLMFFGWEGVGLASYLLIGYWMDKPSAAAANLKAFIINRVGDFSLLIALLMIFHYVGSFEYDQFELAIPLLNLQYKIITFGSLSIDILSLICFLILGGVFTKSAQIPMHLWLPDSMEGPTPISALIHAATMVTAGIFLVIRLFFLFSLSPTILTVMLNIGLMTACLMGLVAFVQDDIKKIIAFSTIAQLGFMMIALGLGKPNYALFHLATHAVFKSLLFLTAGSVIIACHHEQNIMKMGSLSKKAPFLMWMMLIGILSMIGFPGGAGFYSKELILESFESSKFISTIPYDLMDLALIFTNLYSFRLFYFVFIKRNHESASTLPLHDVALSMKFPLVILSLGCLLIGPVAINLSSNNWINLNQELPIWSFIRSGFSVPSFWISIKSALFLTIYYSFFFFQQSVDLINNYLLKAAKAQYGLEFIAQRMILPCYITLSNFLSRRVDQQLIDEFFVNGLGKLTIYQSIFFKKIQTGAIQHYLLGILAGIVIIIVTIS